VYHQTNEKSIHRIGWQHLAELVLANKIYTSDWTIALRNTSKTRLLNIDCIDFWLIYITPMLSIDVR
jgi:hypothetical protein